MMKYVAAAALLTCRMSPTAAAIYDFSYTGSGIVASGQFTTSSTPNAQGFFSVTSLSGTRNGSAISLLPVGVTFDGNPTDNLYRPTGVPFTFPGIGFSDGSVQRNLYADGATLYEFTETPRSGFVIAFVANERVDAAPEPASWALMLAGFGAIGAALRSRQQVSVSFA